MILGDTVYHRKSNVIGVYIGVKMGFETVRVANEARHTYSFEDTHEKLARNWSVLNY